MFRRLSLALLAVMWASVGFADFKTSSREGSGAREITYTFSSTDTPGVFDGGTATQLACSFGTAFIASGDGSATLHWSATRSGATTAALAVLTPAAPTGQFTTGQGFFRLEKVGASTSDVTKVIVRCEVLGAGTGGVGDTADYLVAGEGAVFDVPDPRDADEDGSFASAISCGATFGACLFQSSTGNLWSFDQTTSTWTCSTCRRWAIPEFTKYVEPGPTTNCFELGSASSLAVVNVLADTNVTVCNDINSNVFLGSTSEITIERISATAARGWTGTEGCTYSFSDDEAATTLITLAVPGGGATLLEGSKVSATGTPVMIQNSTTGGSPGAVGSRLSLSSATVSGNCSANDATCVCPVSGAGIYLYVEVMEL